MEVRSFPRSLISTKLCLVLAKALVTEMVEVFPKYPGLFSPTLWHKGGTEVPQTDLWLADYRAVNAGSNSRACTLSNAALIAAHTSSTPILSMQGTGLPLGGWNLHRQSQ